MVIFHNAEQMLAAERYNNLLSLVAVMQATELLEAHTEHRPARAAFARAEAKARAEFSVS
jgi:hypothetical protein